LRIDKRLGRRGLKASLGRALAAAAGLVVVLSANATDPAVANGDTRTLSFYNPHTDESGTFTYLVDGSYDSAVLDKMNWYLRDWRLNESTKMDPKLFDILWEVYRESGSTQPIEILSAYRSPQTNALLRMRSRQVAEHSQHMEGRAIDAHFQDIPVAQVRDIAMRMEEGGVGFYPVGGTPWVHVDSGSVRYWPRMSREALTRLFPDGKTVFIPADGQPMPRYEEARAEIEARGGDVQVANAGGGANFGILGFLFGARGGGADDDEENGPNSVVLEGSTKNSHAIAASAALETPVHGKPTSEPAPTTVVASTVPTAASDAAPAATDAATDFAPLPPRRPSDLVLAFDDAPMPPSRPHDLVPDASPTSMAEDGSAHDDLIQALLQRGSLPGVITRGIVLPPKRALALTEPVAPNEAGDAAAKLARAAALSAPIPKATPPRRPQVLDDDQTTATIAPAPKPTPPVAKAKNVDVAALASAATQGVGPYGGLPLDIFAAARPSEDTAFVAALRGAIPQ